MSGVVGLMLAAGAAVRFGGNKLLHRLDDGRTVAETAAGHLLDAIPSSFAIIRPGDDALEAQLLSTGIQVISCPMASRGMGNSLAWGVAATAEADAWVIALADMPFISAATIHSVVEALDTGAAMVAPYYAGRRGHPVAFGRESYKDLVDMEHDVGARRLVALHPEKLYRVDVNDPGILLDIDTPADLDRSLLLATV